MTVVLGDMELDEVLEWGTSATLGSLRPDAVAAAREVVLDDLGAMVAGHRDDEVVALLAGWPAAPGRATVLSTPRRTADPWAAAEQNGIAGCWLELDGGFRIATAHAGLYTLPATLATTEDAGGTVGDLLTAIVVGYEVAARIVTTWDVVAAGSHAHGSVAPIAAAVASAKVRGLDGAGLARAAGTAATLSMAAPFNHAVHGSLARNLWAGAAARLGCVASHAAAQGIAGLTSSLQDVFGDLYGAPPWTGRHVGELGTAIVSAYHKPYSCCQFLHTAIEASVGVRRELASDGELPEIASVRVEVAGKAGELVDRQPTSSLGARFSLPHAVAASLVHGSGGPVAFSRASTQDPAVAALRDLVVVADRVAASSDDLDDRGATVEVVTGGGRSARAEVALPLGDPDRPFDRAELVRKFVVLSGSTDAEATTRGSHALLDGDLDERPATDLLGHLMGGA